VAFLLDLIPYNHNGNIGAIAYSVLTALLTPISLTASDLYKGLAYI
jgi:hypothetical protein